MTGAVAFVLLALADPATATPDVGAHAPALRLDGEPRPADFYLRSRVFGFDGRELSRRRWLAQSATRGSDATRALGATAESLGGQCDIGCAECRESDQQARDVLQRRRRLLDMHRAFAIGTWASLLVTEVLGTISAVNQDTWFGTGPCASGRPDDAIFGSYGCSGLRSLHLTFAFLTTGLYATTGVLAVAAPDPERVSEGTGRAAGRLRVHKALAWVHATGMILMPLLGIFAANPEIFYGDDAADAGARADFGRAMRSVHQVVGYATFAAYSTAAVLELF